jgi:hypothetical protein
MEDKRRNLHYRPLIMSQKVTTDSVLIDRVGGYLVGSLVLPSTAAPSIILF